MKTLLSLSPHLLGGGRGVSSEDEDANHLYNLGTTIESLKKAFEGNDLDFSSYPNEAKSQIHYLGSLLSKASRALVRINESVEKMTGVKPSSNTMLLSLSTSDTEESNFAKDSQELAHNTKSRKLFSSDEKAVGSRKAEYELRARGYHGFLVEDKKIDSILHAPGGRGPNMYESFQFEGLYSGNGFSASDRFQSSFHFMHHDRFPARRRLNTDGVCDTPTEANLKAERCNLLLSCASKYTLYGELLFCI